MSLYIVIEMLIVVVYDLFRILKIDLFQENVTVDSEKYKIIEFFKEGRRNYQNMNNFLEVGYKLLNVPTIRHLFFNTKHTHWKILQTLLQKCLEL